MHEIYYDFVKRIFLLAQKSILYEKLYTFLPRAIYSGKFCSSTIVPINRPQLISIHHVQCAKNKTHMAENTRCHAPFSTLYRCICHIFLFAGFSNKFQHFWRKLVRKLILYRAQWDEYTVHRGWLKNVASDINNWTGKHIIWRLILI